MGRHAAPSPGSGPPWGKIIGIVVAVAIVAVAGWYGYSRFLGGDSPALAAAENGPTCADPTTVRIATTDDALGPINKIATKAEASSDTCVDYLVTAAPSSVTADAIAKGEDLGVDDPIDAWIPDSPVWPETVQAQQSDTTPPISTGETIATSPVVIGVPAALEDVGESPSWPDLLSSTNWLLPDPQTYTTSLTTVMTFFQSGQQDPTSIMRSFVIGLNEHIVSQSQAFTQAGRSADHAAVFPASEQQIASYNKTHANDKMRAAVASSGATLLTYDWVEVGEHKGPKAGMLDHLEEALTSDEGRKMLNEEGFRTDGVDDVGVDGVPADPTYAVKTPSLQELSDMNAQFLTLSKQMRLLAAIDISGSMKKRDAKNDMSRIELASSAAAGALALMENSAAIGLWTFSTGLEGTQDWHQVTPIKPVGEKESDGRTHREVLLEDLKKLPTELQGDTGLYDTVLAGYKEIQRTYDPQTSNTLIIITDGANDDSTGGLSLDELKSEIRRIEDPAKTVAIVTIGVGKDADQNALQQIADLSRDGNSYHTESPEEIGQVFVDAFLDFPGRD
jgi:Ca-activated chloride channel family protein